MNLLNKSFGFFRQNKLLVAIIILGLLLRVVAGYIFFGTSDVTSQITGIKFLAGENIYETTKYNHYPVWIFLIVFNHLSEMWTGIPYHFWTKTSSMITDVGIGILIYKIVSQKFKTKKTAIFSSAFYIFNPVVLLITSFHGQYESLVVFFLLLLIYYFDRYRFAKVKNKILLLSVFLVTLKGWTILPVLALFPHIQKPKEKLYFYITFLLVMTLITMPFLIFISRNFIVNVFLYYSPPDYGIGGVFEHFPSWFEKGLMSSIKSLFFIYNGLLARLLTLAFILFAIYRGRKLDIYNAMVLLFVTFYSVSSGISSQYLIWIIPFAIISRDRMVILYSLVASLAIITFYLDRYQGAFTPTILDNYITFSQIPFFSYGKMLLLFWMTSAFWMVRRLLKTL